MPNLKKGSSSDSAVRAVRVIGSVFRLRRDLVGILKRHVMPGAGFTMEEADLLIDLYGAAELGWEDPRADENGFVTFEAIRRSLVHSAAALSRRIADLRADELVEVRKASKLQPKGAPIDERKMAVRITRKGIERIRPLYEKHCRVCENLLRDFTAEEQAALLRLNEALMEKLRWGV